MSRRFLTRAPFILSLAILPAVACSEDSASQSADVIEAGGVTQVYTVDGWLSLEDDYLPRVCTQENGKADYQALKAQVVAARTYVLRAMRDNPSLGTQSKPIVNGETFQAYAATANEGCKEASLETRGEVMTWGGALIVANYVAGALVRPDGSKGKDPTKTEFFVTYNEGKSGGEVEPAPHPIASPDRDDNRGCMGQNRAHWLAEQGAGYQTILRYFYGEDITLDHVATEGAAPPPSDDCSAASYTTPRCNGDVLTWCQEGVRQFEDCASLGMACKTDSTYGDQCMPAAPTQDCGSLSYQGECSGDEGDLLRWCGDDGKLQTVNCGRKGLTCGYRSDDVGYDCVPDVEGSCSEGTLEPQCAKTMLVRCRKDEVVAYDCGAAGKACGFFDGRWDCFSVEP